MTPADELEVARTKLKALKAYEAWKVGQLLPLVERLAREGCRAEEFDQRLDTLRMDVQDEVQRVLRAVTIRALKDGAFFR